MNIESKLQDLRERNQIALEELGPNGEILKKTLDQRTQQAFRQLETDDRSREAVVKGFFDLFVWEDFGVGSAENVETISLRWVGGAAAQHRLLEYIPDPAAPFAFTDTTGQRIQPGRFLTDGGTIPDFATTASGIDRFSYLPAYLIHDWEYSLHHCNRLDSGRTQQRVDAALLEALKTMMTTGLVQESRFDFWAIETALSNFAHRYWNANTPCSL